MTSSLIQQSRKAKRGQWVGLFIGVIVIASLIFWKFGASPSTSSDSEESLVETTRGDITISVEGEGKIINPDIINLSFLINGTLREVNVEEGQLVKAEDIIAKLDTRDLDFDLKDAQTQVNISWANIKAKEAELTDQSLRLAKDDMKTAKQSVRNSITEHEQALDQVFESARVTLKTTFPELESALRSVDEIFNIDRQSSPVSLVLNTFNDSIRETRVKNLYQEIKLSRDTLWQLYERTPFLDDTQIEVFLLNAKDVVEKSHNMLEQVLVLFDGVLPSSLASQSLIDQAESSVQSAQGSMRSELNTLTSTLQAMSDAKLNHKNNLLDSERSLQNTQLKLENTERDYERLEVNKETSLRVQYAQLSQAQLRVEKAKYNLSLATLISPIDGEVVIVNGKPGETIKADTASAENAFVRIISKANFTTEVYVEEVDIARIEKGQKAQITLDALPDVILEGTVVYVASTSTIDNNNVTTYLVRVEIVNPSDVSIREGMTSYVEFIQQDARDVLLIPTTSILQDRFVLDENGRHLQIEVGVSDGRMTEVQEGLFEGQKIQLRPSFKNQQERSSRGERSPEERMNAIGERMRENGTLPGGWDNMSTAEKQKALEALREAQGGGGLTGGRQRGGFGGGRRSR